MSGNLAERLWQGVLGGGGVRAQYRQGSQFPELEEEACRPENEEEEVEERDTAASFVRRALRRYQKLSSDGEIER